MPGQIVGLQPSESCSVRFYQVPPGAAGDTLFTIAEAQSFLRIGRSQVFDLLKNGRIPYCRQGARRYIWRSDLVKYLNGSRGCNRCCVSRAWHIRQNAILARTTDIRRRCLLDGCERELAPHRRKFCTSQHADVARQHRHRQAEKKARELDPQRSHFGRLIADDGVRGRLRLKRRSSLPILRRKGDGERIFDRVSPREGKPRTSLSLERAVTSLLRGGYRAFAPRA
jgi:excisionase family DNA binding protein